MSFTCDVKGPWNQNHLQSGDRKILYAHTAANKYPTLFQAGKVLGCKGRRDRHHPSHAVPTDSSGILPFTAPTANRLQDLPLPVPFYSTSKDHLTSMNIIVKLSNIHMHCIYTLCGNTSSWTNPTCNDTHIIWDSPFHYYKTYPNFEIYWKPMWHIDHLKPIFDLHFKVNITKVFNFTSLERKEWWKKGSLWILMCNISFMTHC